MRVLLVLARQNVAAWWVIPESLAPVSYNTDLIYLDREPVVSGPTPHYTLFHAHHFAISTRK